MRPNERRQSGQSDLFRARLDQIIDLDHPVVKLAAAIDWRFLEEQFGAVYTDAPGRPPLPTRLIAGLAILKHMHDLSDEVLCERWVENPYYQLFCGEEFCSAASSATSLARSSADRNSQTCSRCRSRGLVGSRISASASVAGSFIRCMLLRSSALAKARPKNPMSSASRSAWRRPSTAAGAASLSPT